MKVKQMFIMSAICLLCFQPVISQEKEPKKSLNGLEVENPKRVPVFIAGLSEDARKIGLTEERIRTKCELRLRQAGLEPVVPRESEDNCLNIQFDASRADMPVFDDIDIDLCQVAINVVFSRMVHFHVGNMEYTTLARTWEYGNVSTSIHTGGFGHCGQIIDALDMYLDEFLNEYLKANPKATVKESKTKQ